MIIRIFKLYDKISGCTGTAVTESQEFYLNLVGKALSSSPCSRHKYDDFQRMHSRFDRSHSHKFS